MRACTVIAAAELPYARVLAESLGSVALTALVLDDPAGALREDEPFERPAPGATSRAWRRGGCSGARSARPRATWSRACSRTSARRCCWPRDVLVLGAARRRCPADSHVVPRVLEPVASEAVLADGLFDSGLIGAGAGAERRCSRGGASARTSGCAPRPAAPHTLDAAAELFGDDVHVAARPDLRRRAVEPRRARARGRAQLPLRRPRPREPAHARRAHAEGRLADLCEDYAARLRAAGWVERGEDEPASRSRGSPTACRSTTRCATSSPRAIAAGRRLRRPDEPRRRAPRCSSGPTARRRQGAAQGVTRYLEALRARRLDLQDSFQALEDEDGERYVHWARTDGRREGIPEALTPQPAPEAWSGGGEPPALGVNVAGYLRTGIGVGEAARLYVTALESAGVPVRTEVVDPGLPQPKRTGFEDRRPAVEYPFNLVCVNAFELPGFARRIGAAVLRRQAHDRRVGVGGLDRARRAGTTRSRSSTRSGPTPEYVTSVLAPRLAGAGGHAAAAGARAAGGRGRRAAARARRRVHVPVRVRLLLDRAAQEPGRAGRGLHARLRAGRRRAARDQDLQRRRQAGVAGAARARRRRPRRHPRDRPLPARRAEGRAARARRRLRLAAPLRGLRAVAGGGDAARQAGDRHRLLRQPPVHDAGQLVAGRLRAHARSARASRCTRPTRAGPSPTSTTPPS